MNKSKNKSKDIISERFDRNLALLQTVDITIRNNNKKGQFDTTLEQLDVVRCGVADLKHAIDKGLESEGQPADPEIPVRDKDPYDLFIEAKSWLRTINRQLWFLNDGDDDISLDVRNDLENLQKMGIMTINNLEQFYDLTAEKWERTT